MSQKKNVILRNLTLTFSLAEIAEALGKKEWAEQNEYLDADSRDDVYHNGYSASDVKNFREVIPGVNALFPREVAIASEDAERDAYASAITSARHKFLKETLEKVSDLSCEYNGEDSHGNAIMVSDVKGGILEVILDVPNHQVVVIIQNPEHTLNTIIEGMGRFYATEIKTDVQANPEELHSRFLSCIGDYFKVYGVGMAYMPDRLDPDVNDEFLRSELKFKIGELENWEIAERIIDSVENGSFDTVARAIEVASSITDLKSDDIRKLVTAQAKENASAFAKRMQKYS